MISLLSTSLAMSISFANVGRAPTVGRINVFERSCAEVLVPDFAINVVTPPEQVFAQRPAGAFAFDAEGKTVLLRHSGHRHEVQASAVDLASGLVLKAVLGPSRGAPLALSAAHVRGNQILLQTSEDKDVVAVYDGTGSRGLVHRVDPTPNRDFQPLATGTPRALASPIDPRHPYYVTTRVRKNWRGKPELATRLVDRTDGRVVPLVNADAEYLAGFPNPVGAEAQRLALVEGGGRRIRLISLDALHQALRPVGGWFSRSEGLGFERSPVIELNEPLRAAFWLEGTTRVVTRTATRLEIWEGGNADQLDGYAAEDVANVRAVRGMPLLILTKPNETLFYAMDRGQVVHRIEDADVRIFDREPGRAFALSSSGEVLEVRRRTGRFDFTDTGVRCDVDHDGVQVGAVDLGDRSHLIVAGFTTTSAADDVRTYRLQAFPLGRHRVPTPALRRDFRVLKNVPTGLAPGGRHLVFGVDAVRTAIVDLRRWLEEPRLIE